LSKVLVDTIDTRSGTSTMQIGSTNTTTINLGVSGDTVNIPSGVTIANSGTATGFAPTGLTSNMSSGTAMTFNADGSVNKGLQPMCSVVGATDATQTISDTTLTTLQLSVEEFDTGGDYNTGTYTYTTPVAGKYLCHLSISFNAGELATNKRNFMGIYVDGSAVAQNFGSPTGSNDRFSMYQTVLMDLAASKALTGRIYIDNGSSADVWMNSSGIDFTYMNISLVA